MGRDFTPLFRGNLMILDGLMDYLNKGLKDQLLNTHNFIVTVSVPATKKPFILN